MDLDELVLILVSCLTALFVAAVHFVTTASRRAQEGRVARPSACEAPPLALRGVAVSLERDVIFGTSPLGGIGQKLDDALAEDVVTYAAEQGFRQFDTAPLYGLGAAELRLGRGLRRFAYPPEEGLKVWTKVGRLVRSAADIGAAAVVEDPRGATSIYKDLPGGFVSVLDYSARGAEVSYAESVARLGAGVRITGLRVHDPETADLERQAVDGSLVGLRALRNRLLAEERKKKTPPPSASSSTRRKAAASHGDHSSEEAPPPLEVSVGLNDAKVALRLLELGGPLDSIMLAGRWNLLDQSGAAVLEACARRGVECHVAGVYASGLLAGGATYRYARAQAPERRRAEAWARLGATYGFDLKAVALAFAFLPAAVSKVAVGLKSRTEVDETVALVQSARTIPRALWLDATQSGLLPKGLLAL